MKTLIISLLLISSLSHADFEAEVRITDLHYTWGDKADFPLTLYQAGVNYVTDHGQSFGIITGESNKRDSRGPWQLPVELKNFFTFSFAQEVGITQNLSVFAGYAYSEYKEVVRGVPKADTGSGETYGFKYRLNSDISVKASYNMYYTKIGENVGREVTEGVGLSLVARF
jgi:hypothetical protein